MGTDQIFDEWKKRSNTISECRLFNLFFLAPFTRCVPFPWRFKMGMKLVWLWGTLKHERDNWCDIIKQGFFVFNVFLGGEGHEGEMTLTHLPFLLFMVLLTKKFEKYCVREETQFNKHLLSISYAPGNILDTWASEVVEMRTGPQKAYRVQSRRRVLSQRMQFSTIGVIIGGRVQTPEQSRAWSSHCKRTLWFLFSKQQTHRHVAKLMMNSKYLLNINATLQSRTIYT